MLVCRERCVSDISEEGEKISLRIDPSSQHEGVYKKADQALYLSMVTIRDRAPDEEFILLRVAAQEEIEGCKERHEETCGVVLGERSEVVGRGGWDREIDDVSFKSL